MTTRRLFLQGLFAAVAAPAIVRVANLDMVRGVPLRQFTLDDWVEIMKRSNDYFEDIAYTEVTPAIIRASLPTATWRLLNQGES